MGAGALTGRAVRHWPRFGGCQESGDFTDQSPVHIWIPQPALYPVHTRRAVQLGVGYPGREFSFNRRDHPVGGGEYGLLSRQRPPFEVGPSAGGFYPGGTGPPEGGGGSFGPGVGPFGSPFGPDRNGLGPYGPGGGPLGPGGGPLGAGGGPVGVGGGPLGGGGGPLGPGTGPLGGGGGPLGPGGGPLGAGNGPLGAGRGPIGGGGGPLGNPPYGGGTNGRPGYGLYSVPVLGKPQKSRVELHRRPTPDAAQLGPRPEELPDGVWSWFSLTGASYFSCPHDPTYSLVVAPNSKNAYQGFLNRVTAGDFVPRRAGPVIS
ncbi:hypothetical protein AAG570_002600 [Ranatra chinensis]|uniref:Uncharacterized protein n=1 Tax=Ranatra chinensis TaxID=642074 RepID=A0ABD0YQS9_9HEMI